jgi:hypothetical protein
MFFLNNYKGICHISSLLITFGIAYFFFPDFFKSPIYDLLLLVGCFFITNFSIKYVGLDKAVEDGLNKIAKEKSDK